MAAKTLKRSTRYGEIIVAAMIALAVLFTGNEVRAQSKAKKTDDKLDLPAKRRERIRQAIASVGQVFVMYDGKGPFERGSGVIVRRDGIIATNYHVIADERTNRVFERILFDLGGDPSAGGSSLRRYQLEPVLLSKEYDLALLVISSDAAGRELNGTPFSPIEFGESRKVELLEELFIIGFPQKGLSGVTVNMGMVEGVDALGNWIKTTARVIHGNSGGAAVNRQGKLIGIPTKVLVDKKAVDDDGDGFPDGEREYGAVGFLRPAHFVSGLLAQIAPTGAVTRRKSLSSTAANPPAQDERAMVITKPKPPAPATTTTPPQTVMTAPATVTIVRGVVTSQASGNPVAGARVGLVRVGTKEITAETLLAWGGTNAEGKFDLNNAVPAGRYTLKIKAIGYEMLSLDIEVKLDSPAFVIRLRPSS